MEKEWFRSRQCPRKEVLWGQGDSGGRLYLEMGLGQDHALIRWRNGLVQDNTLVLVTKAIILSDWYCFRSSQCFIWLILVYLIDTVVCVCVCVCVCMYAHSRSRRARGEGNECTGSYRNGGRVFTEGIKVIVPCVCGSPTRTCKKKQLYFTWLFSLLLKFKNILSFLFVFFTPFCWKDAPNRSSSGLFFAQNWFQRQTLTRWGLMGFYFYFYFSFVARSGFSVNISFLFISSFIYLFIYSLIRLFIFWFMGCFSPSPTQC